MFEIPLHKSLLTYKRISQVHVQYNLISEVQSMCTVVNPVISRYVKTFKYKYIALLSTHLSSH